MSRESGKEKALISIIIPTRNRSHLLGSALASVAAQTYSNIEVIVIDDGSDTSHASANEACFNALKVDLKQYIFLPALHPLGSGPSYVRNVGIRLARGHLLAFCDDDDYWCDSTYLKIAYDIFCNHAEVDFLFANQVRHVAGALTDSIWLPELVKKLKPAGGRYYKVSKEECLLGPGRHAHMNTCIFPKDLLGDKGFWEGVRYAEDLDLFVRMVDQARNIVYLHKNVSVQNVPDRALKSSASTVIRESDKLLSLVHISHHIILTCFHKASRRYARDLAAHSYRELALAAAKDKCLSREFMWTKLANIWMPTYKWTLYSYYLSTKFFLKFVLKLGAVRKT